MAQIVEKEIREILAKSFDTPIDNFVIKLQDGNKKGEGYFGQLLFVSVVNKKTNEEQQLVIKKVLPSEKASFVDFMSSTFNTEICFYTSIMPALQKFEKSVSPEKLFHNIPKCLGTSSERGKEMIILENIRCKNYEVYPKVQPVSKEMYEEIFRIYGKYHALSFAYKELHPEEFSRLTAPLKNNWIGMVEAELLTDVTRTKAKKIKAVLQRYNEEKCVESFQKYIDQGIEIFKNAVEYRGAHGAILHGDSWSNNMMFKYNESRGLEDIKLIDFQFVFVGSPVHDLSYTFYTGATKDTLDSLDQLLHLYHKTLDSNLQQFGLSADKIYPFEVLKEDWKKYCVFGFIIGFLCWSARFVKEDDVPDLSKDLKNKGDEEPADVVEECDIPIYNLVRHMYDNSFL